MDTSMMATERHERSLRKYGVEEEQYQRVLEATHGHCPGCLKPWSSTRLPCIDHDHESGLWRGILCTNCNYEIGTHHDNAAWFRRIADYLDSPPTLHEGITVYVPGSIGAARRAEIWSDEDD